MLFKPSFLIITLLCSITLNACNDRCINFKDPIIERYAFAIWDLNHDNCIDKKEADAVTEISKPIRKVENKLDGILELDKDESIKTLDDLNHFLNLKVIGARAFAGSINKSITVHLNHITTIGDEAFVETKIASVSMPQVTTIGSGAFAECKELSNVSMPNVLYIGSGAFAECKELSNVSLPNVLYIGYNAFYSNPSLTNLELPNAVVIGNRAFAGCENLSNVSMPNATLIDDLAFPECSNLKNIKLPNTITITSAHLEFTGNPTLDDALKEAL